MNNKNTTIEYLNTLIDEENVSRFRASILSFTQKILKSIGSVLEELNTKLGSKLMETTGTETEVDLVIEDCITQVKMLKKSRDHFCLGTRAAICSAEIRIPPNVRKDN